MRPCRSFYGRLSINLDSGAVTVIKGPVIAEKGSSSMATDPSRFTVKSKGGGDRLKARLHAKGTARHDGVFHRERGDGGRGLLRPDFERPTLHGGTELDGPIVKGMRFDGFGGRAGGVFKKQGFGRRIQ